MTSKNDNSGEAAIAGFIIAGIACMAIFVFAVAAFITFVLTVFCLLSWNKRLPLGSLSIEPHEARAFVGRGLIGMGLLPAFFLFCELFLHVNINWDYLPYYVLGGYILGSLGLEILIQNAAGQQGVVIIEPEPPVPPSPRPSLPAPPPAPFHFASWNDEENMK